MQRKNKLLAIFIAAILIISMSASILTVQAHSPSWSIVSYAYLSVQPSPIGVGQTAAICMWVDTAMPGALIDNDVRRHGYTLTITKPDGLTETKTWDVVNDPTSVQFYRYTPDQVGTYKFEFSYPQQTYTWSGTYQGDIFLASNTTKYLTVQPDAIPVPPDSYPLPTEYWSHPIDEQNTYWYTISSNWLGAPFITGAGAAYIGGQQLDGTAPTSAHIMWTKPMQYGGIVGGSDTNVLGETFYEGLSYNPRFTNPIILQGTMFYQEPYGNAGTGGDYISVDLQTGQELWRLNATATGVSLVPSFGYLYSLDQPNQHGVLPNGLLVASTTAYPGLGTVWRAYDPRSGALTSMNITNVPGGTNVAGPAGEYLKYTLTNNGTASAPTWYLAQWNSSKVFGTDAGASGAGTWYSGTANASLPKCFDWTVRVNLAGTGWTIGTGGRGLVPLVNQGDKILLTQGGFGGHVGDSGAIVTTDPGNITAISLKPSSIGNVLWAQSYPQAPGNNTRLISAWDPNNGIFIFTDKESFANWGYSLDTGNYVWGPSYPPNTGTVDWNYMIWYTPFCYKGNLYSDGFSGLLYCWNDKTGELQWTYGSGGAGNSTSSGLATPYGNYPEFVEAVADGKIYLVGNEHSPDSPMYKGSLLRCVNASNGAELWTIFGWGNMMSGAGGAVADGYLTIFNPYDGQIYCYGKGPSAMTLTAPDIATTLGTSIVIRGTVTDLAAGTTQKEQAARFPYGVPAVSDSSQTQWMQYLYMQKPRPTNVTGVTVTLSVVDSNGNCRTIGTTTSDEYGVFTYTWTPDIESSYNVVAKFAGSESYWPSYAESSFTVVAATPAPTQQPQIILPPTEMYIALAAVAIIIAIALIGAILLMAIRKRQ